MLAAYQAHDTSSPYWRYVEQVEATSPMNYISKDSPQALLAVAGDDMDNPLINSIAMYEKCLEQGRQRISIHSLWERMAMSERTSTRPR